MRPWRNFCFLVLTSILLIDKQDVPPDASYRDWWTIVDYAPNSNRLYLVPGFAHANRLGFIKCLRPWGGNADDHPLYLYQ